LHGGFPFWGLLRGFAWNGVTEWATMTSVLAICNAPQHAN